MFSAARRVGQIAHPTRISALHASTIHRGLLHTASRLRQTEAEAAMTQKLKTVFDTDDVRVEDNSGGCGSQYEVHVVSPQFEGLSKLKQNRLVTQALKEEIAQMHAIRVFTTAPKPNEST
eukprot:m.36130 g.36130  ORF g.36130 m.36130 type:complete len:120 (-) comp12449_c0_seq4:661-1020(-)